VSQLLPLSFLALFADAAVAEIFKCVDPEGQISYQATACAPEQAQQSVRVVDLDHS